MRHPFDGIVEPSPRSRRSWLRGLLASFAGLFAVRAAHAVAPPVSREPHPEPSPEPGGKATTAKSEAGGVPSRALREQGNNPLTRAKGEAGQVTTKALGEEGAQPKPVPPPVVTTLALGEE